jgi:2-amino-4-hydroxy-6-hydroxymethyldihydropteridine diphosphokinase
VTVRAFVGLGSNLNDPVWQLGRGFRALAALPETRLVAESPLYRNDAVGPVPQAAFINGVAELETALNPYALLDALQETEVVLGRKRDGPRWGPRIIDLDLLIYADRRIRDERLTLPHPEIPRRRFVLVPLSDIAPRLVIPGHGSVGSLLSKAPPHRMQRISPDGSSLKAG